MTDSKIEDGGPAFPCQGHEMLNMFTGVGNKTTPTPAEVTYLGLSIRDYFAIPADWDDVRHYATDGYGRNISRAKARYIYADAMLAARKGKS